MSQVDSELVEDDSQQQPIAAATGAHDSALGDDEPAVGDEDNGAASSQLHVDATSAEDADASTADGDVNTSFESALSPMLHAVEPVVGGGEDEIDEPADEDAAPSSSSSARQQQHDTDWPTDDPTHARHYSTHLWHAVPHVLQQAENGMKYSQALKKFLNDKAQLDRDYASKLRSLSENFSSRMSLPSRPKSATSFQASACAVRNLCLNIAKNSEMLAGQLDDTADEYSDAIIELNGVVKPLVQETKQTKKWFDNKMNILENCKRQLVKLCTQLQNEQRQSGASALPPKSIDYLSSGALDLLSDIVSPFLSQETTLKKLATADSAYITAIKDVRSIREEYDQHIASDLAEFELHELKRMKTSLSTLISFAHVHSACYTSHLKNITKVHNVIEKTISPREDLEAFIQDTLHQLKLNNSGSYKPSPLPVYRLFKGHPRYVSTGGKKNQKNKRKASLTDSENDAAQDGGEEDDQENYYDDAADEGTDQETESEVEEPTDDEYEEDLILPSGGRTEEKSDDDGENGGMESSGSGVPLNTALSRKPPVELTASQYASLQVTLDRIVHLPHFSTSAPAEISNFEPERSVVVEMMKEQNGRMAVALGVRRLVEERRIKVLEEKESSEEKKQDGATTTATEQDTSLLLSAAAFTTLQSLLITLLDECSFAMHVQPITSLITSSKSIKCDEMEVLHPELSKETSDTSAATAATSSPSTSSTIPLDSTLYSHLHSHTIFASPRYYEVLYLSQLDKAWRKSSVHRWQTDREQAENQARQRSVAVELLVRVAKEMEESLVPDQTIVDLCAKMAQVNQLDAQTQANLVRTLPSFTRLGIKEMPLLAGIAGTQVISPLTDEEVLRDRQAAEAAAAQARREMMPVAMPIASPTKAAAAAKSPRK